jgi:hypothetical protein
MPPSHQHANHPEPGANLPYPATRLAELPARDPGEAMVAGLKLHARQQFAFARLLVGAGGELSPRVVEPAGERVTDSLELAAPRRISNKVTNASDSSDSSSAICVRNVRLAAASATMPGRRRSRSGSVKTAVGASPPILRGPYHRARGH